jgi:hypothetical protein
MVHIVSAASNRFVVVFPVSGVVENSSVVVGIVQPTLFKGRSLVSRVGRV